MLVACMCLMLIDVVKVDGYVSCYIVPVGGGTIPYR